MSKQQQLFLEALTRMQEKGRSLKRQRQEQGNSFTDHASAIDALSSALEQEDFDLSQAAPAEKKPALTALLNSSDDKEELTTNERVALGRQPPERRKSDMARSA